MDTTPPTTAAILYGAANYIDQHGWHQGASHPINTHTDTPPVCAAAAISMAAFDHITSAAPISANAGPAFTYFARYITGQPVPGRLRRHERHRPLERRHLADRQPGHHRAPQGRNPMEPREPHHRVTATGPASLAKA
jgi:hypothetical protein